MKRQKAKIQLNEVFLEQRPDTQEDNFGGIVERWAVYIENTDARNIGKLVKYNNGHFAYFTHDIMRFDLEPHQVIFIE